MSDSGLKKGSDDKSNRRTGWDRRSGVDRRHEVRRLADVPVDHERRNGQDRRQASKPETVETRRDGQERRATPDLRSSVWKVLDGG